ncbi:hypothetical protein ACFCXP_37570 [Streptomyces niveus]|uniref:hypothetical protein n=1 Tax=Streptomyces niveus TaxID=193462 RepID=UPI0035DFDBF9
MTIDTITGPHDQDDDDGIVDAEPVEPSRMDRLKEKAAPFGARARAVFAGQKANALVRARDWFTAADVSDHALAEEVVNRRRVAAQSSGDQLVREVARHNARLVQAKVDAARSGVDNSPQAERIKGDLAAAEARLQARASEGPAVAVLPPTRKDLGVARWGKKATRTGVAALGGVAAMVGVASDPLIALAALGAAPFGWWYLGRPLEADEQLVEGQEAGGSVSTSTMFDPETGQQVPSVVDPATGVEVPAPHPDDAYVPDTLANLGRVSLVKRAAARVQGEHDLVAALIKAGIITPAQRDETHLVGAIVPAGPGWTATVELPRGIKASTAVGRVQELASAMRIKKSRIEIKADTSADGHEGQFVLWVANADNPYGSKKTESELVSAERWNFWEQGIPMGPDARGERHTMHLLWSSLLVGGLMGYGKSYMVRLIAAAAALDPSVRIIVITGKTGPDWAPLRHVAHQYIAGASPEAIRRALRIMDDTIGEMQERGTELERLYEVDPDKAPEGKITPELAAEGMGPVLLVVDELQELLDGASLIRVPVDEDRDPEAGGRTPTRSGKDLMVDTFARYVRVTRFVGGMGAFITQRPDADSVPTKLREVCAKRGSYRVKGDRSAKMVLGDDAVDAGAAPHLLGEDSKGVVVLDSGAEEGHVTIKADVIDVPQFREIAQRGRQLRIEAGTLTGDAVDYGKQDDIAAAKLQLLTDVLAVMTAAGVEKVRTERLVELLVSVEPGGRYEGLTNAQLQSRLRDAGAGTTRKLGRIDGMANPNGYTAEQIADARDQLAK